MGHKKLVNRCRDLSFVHSDLRVPVGSRGDGNQSGTYKRDDRISTPVLARAPLDYRHHIVSDVDVPSLTKLNS